MMVRGRLRLGLLLIGGGNYEQNVQYLYIRTNSNETLSEYL